MESLNIKTNKVYTFTKRGEYKRLNLVSDVFNFSVDGISYKLSLHVPSGRVKLLYNGKVCYLTEGVYNVDDFVIEILDLKEVLIYFVGD